MTVKEFNDSVDRYADGVYRFILKNLRNEAAAQDVVQETFEKLWKHAAQVNANKVRSYIFTTAYHTMINAIRKQKRQADFEEIDPAACSHDEQYSDLNEVLEQAVQQLPEIQRHVVMLRDYEGYTYDEIGEITGLSASQVKVYIYRARLKLKKFIGSMDAVI